MKRVYLIDCENSDFKRERYAVCYFKDGELYDASTSEDCAAVEEQLGLYYENGYFTPEPPEDDDPENYYVYNDPLSSYHSLSKWATEGYSI